MLAGSGVSTDIWTSYGARIMAISIIPFIIVQLPAVLHTNSQSRIAILIALVVSISLLLSYSLYQVHKPGFIMDPQCIVYWLSIFACLSSVAMTRHTAFRWTV